MRPLTETIPKSLIPVEDRPFLSYQLEWLQLQGVTDVVLCIGHQGQRIRDYVSAHEWNLQISFVDEGEGLRGTGGALKLTAEKGMLHETFFVMYGDSFLPINFFEVWQAFKKSSKSALMTIFKNQGKWDSSNVEYHEGYPIRYKKNPPADIAPRMSYIDYGLSILKRSVTDLIPPATKIDLATIFENLSIQNDLESFEVSNRFYEIGSPAGLTDFEEFAKERFTPLITQQPRFL